MISIVTRSVTDIILLSLHFLIQKHVPLLERPNEADRQTDRRAGGQPDRQGPYKLISLICINNKDNTS